MIKRIAVDFAKFVYQAAESVRIGQVSQRKLLSQAALGYIYRSKLSRSSG